jgi:non-heme chloroperoxidase
MQPKSGIGCISICHTIQCTIELRDADLRKDLDNIQVPTLILHGVNDHACLFHLPKLCMRTSKGHNLYRLKKARHGV